MGHNEGIYVCGCLVNGAEAVMFAVSAMEGSDTMKTEEYLRIHYRERERERERIKLTNFPTSYGASLNRLTNYTLANLQVIHVPL